MEQLYLMEVFVNSVELYSGLVNVGTIEKPHVVLNVYLDGLGLSFEIDQDEFKEDLQRSRVTLDEEHNVIEHAMFTKFEDNSEKKTSLIQNMSSAESIQSGDDPNGVITFPVRAGKSCLFGGHNDTVLEIMERNSLEFTLRLKGSDCSHNCVGVVRALWDAKVLQVVADKAGTAGRSVTQCEQLLFKNEETTEPVGMVNIFIRFSILGSNIRTRFNKIASEESHTFTFKSIGDYELLKCQEFNVKTIKKQDSSQADAKMTLDNEIMKNNEESQINEIKEPISKTITFKQIIGPCGKVVCPLAKKLKDYLKRGILHKVDVEERRGRGEIIEMPDDPNCGCCCCKKVKIDDDNAEMDENDSPSEDDLICPHCGGKSSTGKTCDEDMSKDYLHQDQEMKCCPCLSSRSISHKPNCLFDPYRLDGFPKRQADRKTHARDIKVGPEYLRIRNFLRNYMAEHDIAVEYENDSYSIGPSYVCRTKCATSEDCNRKQCV